MAKKRKPAAPPRPKQPVPDILRVLRTFTPEEAESVSPRLNGWALEFLAAATAKIVAREDDPVVTDAAQTIGRMLDATVNPGIADTPVSDVIATLTAFREFGCGPVGAAMVSLASAAGYARFVHDEKQDFEFELDDIAAGFAVLLLVQLGDDELASRVASRYQHLLPRVARSDLSVLLTAPFLKQISFIDRELTRVTLEELGEPPLHFMTFFELDPLKIGVEVIRVIREALIRWRAWAPTKSSPLLPKVFDDTWDVPEWTRYISVFSETFARFAFKEGKPDEAESYLVHVRPEQNQDLIRLVGKFGVGSTQHLRVPEPGSERDSLFDTARTEARNIERAYRRVASRKDTDEEIHQVTDAIMLRGVLALARDDDAFDVFAEMAEYISDTEDGVFGWGWWQMLAAVHRLEKTGGVTNDPDFTFRTIIATLITLTVEVSLPPSDLFPRFAQVFGYDWEGLCGMVAPTVERFFAVYEDDPALAVRELDGVLKELVGDLSHSFLFPIVHLMELPFEFTRANFVKNHPDHDRFLLALTARDQVLVELARRITSESVPEPEPSFQEIVTQKREERRAARRREHEPVPEPDREPVVEPEPADTPEAVLEATRDTCPMGRKELVRLVERIERIAAENTPESVIGAADLLVTSLTTKPEVRDAVGDTEADILTVRLWHAVGKDPEAAALTESLFWRLFNAGDPRAEGYAVFAEELGASPESVETMREALRGPGTVTGPDPDTPVRVVFVGGRDEQARAAREIDEILTSDYPHVTVEWFHPAWTTNTGAVAAKVDRALTRADVLVLMQVMPTVLGETLRTLADTHGVPWVACTGRGRSSMLDAVLRAARIAKKTKVTEPT